MSKNGRRPTGGYCPPTIVPGHDSGRAAFCLCPPITGPSQIGHDPALAPGETDPLSPFSRPFSAPNCGPAACQHRGLKCPLADWPRPSANIWSSS